MIVKRGSNLANLLKKFLKDYNTQNCSMIVLKTSFDKKEKTVSFVFSESIETVVVKDESVDFSASVNGSFLITAILSELEKNEQVEITCDIDKGVVRVGSIEFEQSEFESKSFISGEADVAFTKEELDELGKDFIYTSGNWFVSPKTTDVIGFFVYEGSLYKVLPGVSIYKIGKFKALVNTVRLEQDLGHSTLIWLFPRPIYDLFAGDEMKVMLTGDNLTAFNSWLSVYYTTPEMSSAAFKRKITAARNATADEVAKSPMKPYKAIDFSAFTKNNFESEEDRNVKIFKDLDANKNPGEMTVVIDDAKFKAVFEGIDEGVPLNTNLSSLTFILGQISDSAQITEANTETDSVYVIIDGDEFVFIPHVREIGC